MGNKVWLDLWFINMDCPNKKLDIYRSKFTILERIESYAYRLDTPPEICSVFHTWLLCLAADNLFLRQTQVDWQPPAIISEDGEETFKVKAILNKWEVKKGQVHWRELLVK